MYLSSKKGLGKPSLDTVDVNNEILDGQFANQSSLLWLTSASCPSRLSGPGDGDAIRPSRLVPFSCSQSARIRYGGCRVKSAKWQVSASTSSHNEHSGNSSAAWTVGFPLRYRGSQMAFSTCNQCFELSLAITQYSGLDYWKATRWAFLLASNVCCMLSGVVWLTGN